MTENLVDTDSERQLDIGCVAAHGYFRHNPGAGLHDVIESERAGDGVPFRTYRDAPSCGTVPMIDVMAYTKWIPNDFDESASHNISS